MQSDSVLKQLTGLISLKQYMFDEIGHVEYMEMDLFSLGADCYQGLEYADLKINNVSKLGLKFHMVNHLTNLNDVLRQFETIDQLDIFATKLKTDKKDLFIQKQDYLNCLNMRKLDTMRVRMVADSEDAVPIMFCNHLSYQIQKLQI